MSDIEGGYMAKKYYAVRTGRKTGVFMTWAECQFFVRHFFTECVLFSILQNDHSVGKFTSVRAVTAIYVGNYLI